MITPRRTLTVSAAIDDRHLLGTAFAGPSWDTWRAVLRAAEGLPLSPGQRELFYQVAERDPPPGRVRELWVVAGRRCGKDSIASAIATAVALGDHRAHLRPGERASMLCLAVDRQQARIVNRYIKGYFSSKPLLRPLVKRETDEGLELENDVEIVISTNNFRSVRGRTIVCAIFDELPGLVTLLGALLIGISSPYRRSGLLFERWSKNFGQASPDVLVVKGASTAFNPLLPHAFIDAELERDPEGAAAEWLGEWRSDLADFVDRAAIDAVVIPGRHELPPLAGVHYVGFCDPSGGSADAMTLAIAHAEDGIAILDCLRERRPPFSPEAVAAEFSELLKQYRCSRVTGDRYGGEWPREQFSKRNIKYEPAERSKSDIYRDVLPLVNSGKVELLDNTRLIAQLCSLERRTARGGRDTIDHPAGAHDDIANAAAGALVMVGSRRRAIIFTEEMLRQSRQRPIRTFNQSYY